MRKQIFPCEFTPFFLIIPPFTCEHVKFDYAKPYLQHGCNGFSSVLHLRQAHFGQNGFGRIKLDCVLSKVFRSTAKQLLRKILILTNSKEILEHLKSPTFNHVTNIKSFDFSILYTTIPHQKLKDILTSIICNSVFFTNCNCRYKYLALGYEKAIS